MLVGYNTNITYKGNVYHVQTEDNGLKNPYIITLLYFRGTILSSKKISYAQYAASPDYKTRVRELMKVQHKQMIKELISGKHTDTDTPADSEEKESPKESENPAKDAQGQSKIEKSLDDILLDYIIKRND